eukprot:GDKJ01013704.1.p1 GENE.GDKJ01013704.1~~GDKJ01013704.1.p1  ORF type:complete len:821 (-),score=217.77 GDKJ01013704.1:40-2502(-)
MSDITKNWSKAKDGTVYTSFWSLAPEFWSHFNHKPTTLEASTTNVVSHTSVAESSTEIHCSTCNSKFENQKAFKTHCASSWHVHNLKSSLKGKSSITLEQFSESNIKDDDSENEVELQPSAEDLKNIRNDEESEIETSEDSDYNQSSSEEDNDDESQAVPRRIIPFLTLAPHGAAIFNPSLFTRSAIRSRLLDDEEKVFADLYKHWSTSTRVCVALIRAGRFAGCIFENGQTLIHTVITTYAVRRKAGGAQSSHDGSKGKAKSVGASLRRAGEEQLKRKVRVLLNKEWADLIHGCGLVFVSSSNTVDEVIFDDSTKERSENILKDARKNEDTAASFAPFRKHSDSRLRPVTVQIEKPTFGECKRVYEEVQKVKWMPMETLQETQETARKAIEQRRQERLKKKLLKIASRTQKKSKAANHQEDKGKVEEKEQFVLPSSLPPFHTACSRHGSLNLVLWTLVRVLMEEKRARTIGEGWREVVSTVRIKSGHNDTDDDSLQFWDQFFLNKMLAAQPQNAEDDDDEDEEAEQKKDDFDFSDPQVLAGMLAKEIENLSIRPFSSTCLPVEATSPPCVSLRSALSLILNSIDGDLINDFLLFDSSSLSGGRDWRMVRDSLGRTALHVACDDARPDVVALLLTVGGFDPSLIDLKGRNAWMCASTNYNIHTSFILGKDKKTDLVTPAQLEAVRDTMRRCRGLMGEDEKKLGFSWSAVGVGEPVDARSERERLLREKEKKREARRKKRVKQKAKKEEEQKLKAKEEQEKKEREEMEKKMNSCLICQKVFNPKTAIERLGYKYCSTDCSYKHMRQLAADAAEARMKAQQK